MRKLDKSTLALTFKFDCDRFLRFRLATTEEQHHLGLALDRYKRPGIQLITAAGRRWEADKYQDLLDVTPVRTCGPSAEHPGRSAGGATTLRQRDESVRPAPTPGATPGDD